LYAYYCKYLNSSCIIASNKSEIFRNLNVNGDTNLQQAEKTTKELEQARATIHNYNLLRMIKDTKGIEEQIAIATIKEANPTDIQEISASKLTLSNSFYNNALRQSQQSFLWALILAGVGAVFIIVAVTLVIVLQPTIATSVIIAVLGGTGGAGSSAISYATLQLYKQASEQAAACHIRLDRASDFILANSACEGLEGQEKQQMRSEIIRKLVE
jgi:hypothetical protein